MSKTKCSSCGLVDFAGEEGCRRCGFSAHSVSQSVPKSRSEAPRRTIPILPVAVAAAGAFGLYYFFGAEPTKPLNANVAVHANTQPQPQPTLSARAEYEQKTSGSYKNAIQTSPGLAASQKHLEETQKLMK